MSRQSSLPVSFDETAIARHTVNRTQRVFPGQAAASAEHQAILVVKRWVAVGELGPGIAATGLVHYPGQQLIGQ